MKRLAIACVLLCMADTAGAETVSYSFGGSGFPISNSFTITGFNSALGTLDSAVVTSSGSATFTLSSSSGFAPTVQYTLQSSQGLYQSNGPATYGGNALNGSGTVSYTNPGASDFTYRVTLTGTGQRNYTTASLLAQFINTDIVAYYLTDQPVGSLSYNGSFLNYEVVSGSATAAGTITYSYTPLGSAVPEPASWAMMIGGVGLAGGAFRRRGAVAART